LNVSNSSVGEVEVVEEGLRKTAALLFVLTAAQPCFAADEVVLTTRDFVVTTQDFERYLSAQKITGDRRERTLSRKGAVTSVFENIYGIRAFAAQGERNPAIDQDEIQWLVQSFRERLLMNRQLDFEVENDMRALDWDALAEEQYKANKASYIKAEQVSAAHILVSFKDRTEEEALTRSNEVLTRLQAGEVFAELAKEYSDDSGSAGKGGELGFFTRQKMVKPFEDAVFAMQKSGETSAPVKSKFGYHIIRFNERKPERQLSFESVKGRIIPEEKKRIQQSLRDYKITEMKNGSVDQGLEINAPLLEQIEQQYRKPVETGSAKQ
jgi:peptidyl-prolyl cis-trans isomerase C